MGPQGLLDQVEEKLKICKEGQKDFYESVKIVMEGAKHFMVRYHDLIMDMAENELEKTNHDQSSPKLQEYFRTSSTDIS
jgi:hypothetical protein